MDIKAVLINTLLTYVVPIVISLMLTGLVALMGWLGKTLKAKFEADGNISLMEGAILKVTDVATSVVHEVEAGTKAKMEALKADGKLDAADYKALADEALAKLKSSLGTEGLKQLGSTLGMGEAALDTYLKGKLEQAVTSVSTKQAVKEAASDAPFAKMPGGLGPQP